MMINSFTHKCTELGVRINVIKKSYNLQEIQNESRNIYSNTTLVDVFIGKSNELE